MESGVFRPRRAFELAIVRHGRTAWNADGRFQGHTDVPLDDVGVAQAAAVGRGLADLPINLAVASDLSRARDTGLAVLGDRPVELAPDARWREMRFGAWEGLAWPQIVERFPEAAAGPSKALESSGPPGGESFDELCARVLAALEALGERAREGDRALVATHAGPLHALLRVALGRSDADALGVRFAPASVTRLALAPDGASVVRLNETFEPAS